MSQNSLYLSVKEAQPLMTNHLANAIKQKRVTHAYIITHENSDLSYDFSLWIAQSVFCNDLKEGLPCGNCENCRRIIDQEFPDMTLIEPDGQTIKVDQVRELKKTFVRSGIESKKKGIIIKEAEKMTVSAANGLLKFIEEPDSPVYIFFLCKNVHNLLPTIQSRCQIIHLKPTSKQVLKEELKKTSNLSDNKIEVLAELTDSFTQAVELSNDEWFNSAIESVFKWFDYLQEKEPISFIYVQQKLIKLVTNKSQQFMVLDILIILYRLALRKETKNEINHYLHLTNTIELIINARKKIEANVSFQNTSEQLVLQILTKHH